MMRRYRHRQALACSLAILLASAVGGTQRARSAAPPPVDAAKLEAQIDGLLKQLTLDEKIGLCSGTSGNFRGVARLKIPDFQWTDGPRGPNGGGPSTAFPCGVMFGSTWDPDLIGDAGKVMGEETRSEGKGILLGPGINIQRDPLGGRFFEYYTEDPFLNSRLTASIVTGIQSQGVAACLKHYACNNREDNRNFYMSMVDPRTLHEVYLPAFKAGVQEGHAWSIMTSANGVNGDFVSDSKLMLTDILKNGWGFDGMVLTDWLQTRSTEKAALAGLDVSMPGGDCGFAGPLTEAVKAGRVPVSVIDDKARRILRTYGRAGWLSDGDHAAGAARNTPEHQKVARKVAEEGIVLLKNDKRLLPLNASAVKNVLVLGPNADARFCQPGLGGSSWISGPYEITTLAGIRNVLGDRAQYLPTGDLGGFQPIPVSALHAVNGKQGFAAKYYAAGQQQAAVERVEPQVNFMWEMKSPDASISPDGFRAVFTGKITPPVSGVYTLKIDAGGEARVFDTETGGTPIASADKAAGRQIATAAVRMEQGKPFTLRVEYERQPGDAALNVTWQTPNAPEWYKVDDAVRKADTVVVVAGLNEDLDTEGRDRMDMRFPADQEVLINRVARLNPRTVVVLVNGSPMEVGGWLKNVPGVVEAWYPGMEGGNALADVLFGNIDPSGRLPFTWPRTLADSPSHALGTQNNDRVDYKEGLLVGYRYYDTKHVAPQFPFGYGLSYTTFSFGRMNAARSGKDVKVSLTVKNTGTRPGIETVQIYVHPLKPSVSRPVHELKAFRRVSLKPGESSPALFTLGPDAFSYFDAAANRWRVDPGAYEIEAGTSSEKIMGKAKISYH